MKEAKKVVEEGSKKGKKSTGQNRRDSKRRVDD